MKSLNLIRNGILVLLVLTFSFFVSSFTFSNPSISRSYFDSISPMSTSFSCEGVNDFHLQVAPTGCIPTVVRSDLLEEQNVAVFCPISVTKVNPAVSVDSIKSMSFSGNHPSMVSGVGFYPANAALSKSENSLSNFPVLENIGYAVIVLKRTENESAMPKVVQGNLTARISYDSKKAFGIGDVDFYLPELSDYNWKQEYKNYGFWFGKGFLRAENIDSEGARISVYSNEDKKISSFNLKKGESSSKVYLPGFYCSAGFEVKLLDLVSPRTTVSLRIDDDYYSLAEGDRFLENRCQVRSILKRGISEQVSIHCSRDDSSRGSFSLVSSPRVALSVGEKSGSYVVGDKISYNETNDFYLAYLDSQSGSSKVDSSELVVWIASEKKDELKSVLSDVELEKYSNRISSLTSSGKFYSNVDSFRGSAFGIYPILFGKEGVGKIKNNGFFIPEDSSASEVSNDNLLRAVQTFSNLTDLYPHVTEKDSLGKELDSKSLSEKGLILGIELAIKLGDGARKEELVRKILESYPSNENREYVRQVSLDSFSSNSGRSSEVFSVNSVSHSISLEGIQEPSFSSYGALLTIYDSSGRTIDSRVSLTKNFIHSFNTSSSVSLVSLSAESAELSVTYMNDGQSFSKRISVKTGTFEEAGGYRFRIDELNFVPMARVSIVPRIDNEYGISNISYSIGIEKRAIQLSPAKIEEKIRELNKSIKKWESISDTLGNVVSGLRGACLATGAILTVKNFFSGINGETTARTYAMRGIDGNGGIYKECNERIASGKDRNLQDCLSKTEIKSRIESLTKEYKEILNNQQETLTRIRENSLVETSGLSLEKVVDDKKYLEEYSNTIGGRLEMSDLINGNYAKEGIYSISDLRTLDLCNELKKKNPELWKSSCEKSVESITKAIRSSVADSKKIEESKSGNRVVPIEDVLTMENQVSLPYRKKTISSENVLGGGHSINGEVPISTFIYNNKEHVAFLKESAHGDYIAEKIFEFSYSSDGKLNLGEDVTNNLRTKISKFVPADSYETEVDPCVVRYFGSDPDKGRPAIVPFLFKKGKGWYVGVRHATVSLGSSSNYDKSGAVSSYYICNAGDDGIINFNPDMGAFSGGDYCTSFSVSGGTVAESEAFGLSKSETRDLAIRAIQAIKDAGIYSPGKKSVTVTGRSCTVGDAAADLIQTQCQDFMSPKDCEILFNVCDPVVCPSSRCNLGGAYPVADVIQSGIIGSIVLCFPNFKFMGGDVYVPICLSGLKAGLDSYISILKSYRGCLEEKLRTGKTVGVCDQVYSIYLCEFFWSQSSAIIDLVIPRAIQFFSGELVRGGGEYMNVQEAWKNAQGSASYFTSQYASGSFDILDGSTVSNLVQTEFCKRFASASVPSWKKLAEPIVPAQFHGSFEEIPFNDAVVPPVSQYSVFYHIYAGKNEGTYYRVYLKSPEGSTVYASNPTIVVDSGYIPAGEYVSEKKDFITSSGYKKMCIVVGEQEECGFGSVSTSFALDYLSSKVASESGSQTGITSEGDCVSGTRNAFVLANLNVQEGLRDYLNPDISSQGIVRVCSTNNPGATTEPGRWEDVGYCDDENIKCWVDTKSVKDAIDYGPLREKTLGELESYSKGLLDNESVYSADEFNSIVKEFENAIESKSSSAIFNNISKVDSVLDSSGKILIYDYQRAKLIYLKGKAYSVLAVEERVGRGENVVETASTPKTEEGSKGGSDAVGGRGEEASSGGGEKKEIEEIERDVYKLVELYDGGCKEVAIDSSLNDGYFPIYLKDISGDRGYSLKNAYLKTAIGDSTNTRGVILDFGSSCNSVSDLTMLLEKRERGTPQIKEFSFFVEFEVEGVRYNSTISSLYPVRG